MDVKSTLESMFEEITKSGSVECMMDGNCYGKIKTALDNQQIVYTVEDSYGGEDQGSDYWCVWKFSKDGEQCFVKFYGYYASHYGTEYQGWKFVTPQQKTVIVYK